MGVRVINKATGETITVPPEEAQRALLAGDVLLADDRLIVKWGDNKLATVAAKDFDEVRRGGWELSDAEEARKIKLRREEADIPSQILAGIEAALSQNFNAIISPFDGGSYQLPLLYQPHLLSLNNSLGIGQSLQLPLVWF